MHVAAIVLAAGASRRLGQPKQLVRHNGEALVARAMRLAREGGASPVLVVLGANAEAIEAAVRLDGALRVWNERWREGMSTSIHAGLRALEDVVPEADGVLMMSCDQPLVTAAHLHALMDVFGANSGAVIVGSSYAGAVGVPAVFPRQAYASLLAIDGDKGARALLARPPCGLVAIDLPGGELDIDEPGDLARLD